jgi:hypothetical protein
MMHDDDPRVLGLLLGAAALLYLATWLLAGPPGRQGTPETATVVAAPAAPR